MEGGVCQSWAGQCWRHMTAGSKAVMAAKDDVPVRWGSQWLARLTAGKQGHLPCWMGWPRGGSTGPTCLRVSGLLSSLCEDRSSVGASHLGASFQGTLLPEGPLTWAPSHLGTLPPGGLSCRLGLLLGDLLTWSPLTWAPLSWPHSGSKPQQPCAHGHHPLPFKAQVPPL